jgi:hypothetical protein
MEDHRQDDLGPHQPKAVAFSPMAKWFQLAKTRVGFEPGANPSRRWTAPTQSRPDPRPAQGAYAIQRTHQSSRQHGMWCGMMTRLGACPTEGLEEVCNG